MNKCFKCGTEFDGEFCPQCGTAYEKEKVCPNCQSVVDGSVKFCNHCGFRFVDESAATNVNVSALSVRMRSISIWNILAKSFPVVGMYALALFSLLLWAFFAAPFSSMLSESLGNVYTTLNGVIDDFLPIAKSSLAFAVITLVYSIAVIVLSFVPKTAKVTAGKVNLVTLLSFCGNLLYIPFFALGCATATKCKEIFMENGSFVGITIAFSIVFLCISVGSTLADILLRKYNVMYKQAYDDNKQAKADKEEHRNKLIAERRAKAVQILAENGIVEPEAVTCDKMLRRKIWLNFKMPELICFAFPVSIFLGIQSFGNLMWNLSTRYDELRHFPIALTIFYYILAIILWGGSAIAVYMPIKMYCQNNSKKTIKKLKIRQFLVVIGMCATFLLQAVTYFSVEAEYYNQAFDTLTVFMAFYVFIGITVFILYIVNLVIRININRIFNINGKGKYKYTTFVNDEEVPLTIELFCRQRNDYETYRKDKRYYEYNIKKVVREQQIIEKPKYSKRNKKLGIITIVCTAVMIALYSIIPYILIDTNFQYSKVSKISPGITTKDEVVIVLGKADIETDYVWSYYSSNYIKLMRKAEDLSNQMATVQSIEEAMKIQAELDKVQEKMENTTYKYIIVTFMPDGKVSKTDYNFNYNPSSQKNGRTTNVLCLLDLSI